jgi:hypothetical protein
VHLAAALVGVVVTALVLRQQFLAQREGGLCRGHPFRLVAVQQRCRGPGEHGGQLPAQVVGVLDAGVHALAAGRVAHVGRVARQEHPAVAEPLGQPDIGPPHRRPGQLVQPDGLVAGGRRDLVLQVLQRDVGIGRLHGEGEQVRAGQWHQRDTGLAGHPHPAVRAVQPGQPHIGEQCPHRLVGLAVEADAETAAHRAPAAVGADQIPGAQPGRPVGSGQRRGHAVVVLVEVDQCRGQFDVVAETGQPLPQQLLGAELRQEPDVRVRHVRPRRHRLGRGALPDHLVALVAAYLDAGVALGEHGVHDADVVEDLKGAWLETVRPGAAEELLGLVHQPETDSSAGQLDSEHQPGRPAPHDQHVHVSPGQLRHDDPPHASSYDVRP